MESDLEAGVACTCSLSSLSIEVVLDHDDLLAAVWVLSQHALDRRVRRLALSACDVPPTHQSKLSKHMNKGQRSRFVQRR